MEFRQVSWAKNDGAPSSISGERVLPLASLPDGMVASAINVDLDERGIAIPRTGTVAFATTGSAPADPLRYLFGYRNGATEQLFAVSSAGMYMWTGATWSSITGVDTPVYNRDVMAVHYNGKVFVAYDSSVNRLHLYDGTVMRRVGVDQPSAATVANTGAGAYPATIRYYKVQMAIRSGSSSTAQSELSAVVSFTPSGAGTHARITKPATVDSASHWRVFGSSDGVTFYAMTDWIVVGTTTWDDDDTPASYSTPTDGDGTVAPEVGLFVPPPSARFLATDGTRLIMAGSYETSATSSQTATSAKRVWFTRPIGAICAGDDESVTQTADFRYYIDIDDPNNTTITGIAAIGGMVYVFFDRAVWRLVPSGIDNTPYRSEQVSSTVGAISQQAICVGSTPGAGDDAAYFVAQRAGLHRVSPSRGLEWLGRDVVPRVLPNKLVNVTLFFDPVLRDVWVFANYLSDIVSPRAINVELLQRRGGEPHGGARVMSFRDGGSGGLYTTAAFYDGALVFGGENDFGGYALDTYGGDDDNGQAFTASVEGPILSAFEHRFGAEEPVIQTDGVAGTVTVGYTDRLSSPVDSRTVSVSVPAVTAGYIGRVFGLTFADGASIQPTISLSTPDVVVQSLSMRVSVQEPL